MEATESELAAYLRDEVALERQTLQVARVDEQIVGNVGDLVVVQVKLCKHRQLGDKSQLKLTQLVVVEVKRGECR